MVKSYYIGVLHDHVYGHAALEAVAAGGCTGVKYFLLTSPGIGSSL